MTTKRISNGILAGLLLMAAGCAENNPWNEGGDVGSLRPEVTVDASVGAAMTRAQIEQVPEADVPSPSDFTLEITKSDGSYSKSWLLADYDPESVALRSGNYTVTARYGDPRDEGNKRPYFVGSADVKVKAGQITPVNVEVELGNALMELTQTDNFLGYFSDFSLQLHSGETGAYVPVPVAQTDPTYVHPGQVAVVLSYTTWEGKSATIRPVSLDVKAKKYYHVKLDLDTEMSGGVLKVTFDNGVSEEEVDVDLSAVENSPEPTITAVPAVPQAILEGTRCSEPPVFTLLAPAGIQSVALTMVSEPAYTFSYAGQNLCALSADGQAAVEAAGIKTVGLFKNPDKMAEIDLSGFASKLPPGDYEVTATLTDVLSRQTSATLNFHVEARSLIVQEIQKVAYGVEEVEVVVDYNGDPKFLTFSVTSDTGAPQAADLKDIQKITNNTGAFAVNSYKARIAVPPMRCERGIWVRIGESVADGIADQTVSPIYPNYSVQSDIYSNRAYVKVEAEELNTVMENLRCELYLNTDRVTDVAFESNPQTGIITIKGLLPGHDYKLAHSLDSRAALDVMELIEFVTEQAVDVPNGNFNQITKTINISDIQVGGHYRVSPVDYTIKSSIEVDEPDGWASINAKTCYEGSSNKNTWYLVPSTFVNEGVVTLRSVAYDHAGKDIPKSGGAFNMTYYCENAPDNISYRAAGELFLGSYSYNGTESRIEGIEFSSRPSSIEFNIEEYTPYGSDQGLVSVEVIGDSGDVLCSGRKVVTKEGTIKIPLSYGFGTKASKLKVGVKSSTLATPNTLTPEGSALNEHKGLGNHTIPANSYHALSVGSVLRISSIKLNYE